MLSKLQTVLRRAQRRKYAVGAFNVSDLEQMQAVLSAASALRSPVIINVSEKAIQYAGRDELAALARIMAKRLRIPVVLNLDHGKSVSECRACLRAGFSGLMYDGSRESDPDNTRHTAEVVRIARPRRIGVEGELGQVRYTEDASRRAGSTFTKTDPERARAFVKATGICAFAVAIGNAHGLPEPDEKLDFPLLKRIRNLVQVPLVLHGASSTPARDIRRAISLGIAKINIDTDLRVAFAASVRAVLKREPQLYDPRRIIGPARDAVGRVVAEKIRIFGSAQQI